MEPGVGAKKLTFSMGIVRRWHLSKDLEEGRARACTYLGGRRFQWREERSARRWESPEERGGPAVVQARGQGAVSRAWRWGGKKWSILGLFLTLGCLHIFWPDHWKGGFTIYWDAPDCRRHGLQFRIGPVLSLRCYTEWRGSTDFFFFLLLVDL